MGQPVHDRGESSPGGQQARARQARNKGKYHEDEGAAKPLRELLDTEGAEAVDAARHQWWIGLRNAEKEHYTSSGRDFNQDEKFYRLGFEAALHARTRCMEFDQSSAEMESQLDDVQREHPGEDVTEGFTRGYQRGRDYYQKICNEERAA